MKLFTKLLLLGAISLFGLTTMMAQPESRNLGTNKTIERIPSKDTAYIVGSNNDLYRVTTFQKVTVQVDTILNIMRDTVEITQRDTFPLIGGPQSGMASKIPAHFEMVASTSFEDVRKINDHEMNWDIRHWVEFAAMHRQDGGSGNGEGGARFWIAGNRAHSGNKSIGLEVSDIEQSRRAELLIYPEDLVGKEYFVSYYLFIPNNFGLFEPNIDWDWMEIAAPFAGGLPYAAFFITNPDNAQKNFDLALSMRGVNNKMSDISKTRMELPKNRWVKVEYYVKRDVRDGEIRFWFDGELFGEAKGIQTLNPDNTVDFQISLAKVYYERGDKRAKKIWMDDVEIWANPN